MRTWKQTFGIIWTGQLLSILSTSMVNFAIILWLSIEHNSAEVLAYAAIAGMLPQSILGLVAGAYVDKWNRKLTMILSDGFIAFCTLLIALLFYIGATEVGLIYLLLAFRSVGAAFHMPAMQASIPLLAPESELLRISGVNQMIQSLSIIAGPALGALAISVMDIEKVLLFDVAGAVLAIISLLLVHIPNPKKQENEPQESLLQQISNGIQTVLKNKGLMYLFVASMVMMFCIMPVAVIFPLFTLRHFNGGAFEMSVIEVIWGVGMLLGGVALGMLKISYNKAIMTNTMCFVVGLTFLLSGILNPTQFWIFVVLTAIGGLSAAVYNACFTTIIQEQVEPALLGRVFSLAMSISILPSLIGLLSTGYLADSIGIAETFVILGTLICIVGITSFFVKDIIRVGRKSN
jgi:DHA3 family macrolide efflux protein-like MFS transporter